MYCYVPMMDDQQQSLNQQSVQDSSFYQNLSKNLFKGESEKSLVDKLLGRQDADKVHTLMQKEPLTRSDIEEILFLMTSIDQKIVNYNEWDRYVIVKYFPWIKDYSTICKTWMLYEEQYLNGDFDDDFAIMGTIKYIDPKTKKAVEKKGKVVLEEVKKIVYEISKYLQHNLKFLISTFLLLQNSTLSIDGAAFETLTTSRFEYSYHSLPLPQPQERRSVINMFKKK